MAVLRILLAVVMTLGRLLPFLVVGALLFFLWRRSVRKGEGTGVHRGLRGSRGRGGVSHGLLEKER